MRSIRGSADRRPGIPKLPTRPATGVQVNSRSSSAQGRLCVGASRSRPAVDRSCPISSDRSQPSRSGRDRMWRNQMSGYRSRKAPVRCAQGSSLHRILGNADALWRRKTGGKPKVSLASAVQRVRVQPVLVLEEPSQRQCDLPVLVAFRSRWERPGMKQDVAPEHLEIVHPVERQLGRRVAIGRWHVVPP